MKLVFLFARSVAWKWVHLHVFDVAPRSLFFIFLLLVVFRSLSLPPPNWGCQDSFFELDQNAQELMAGTCLHVRLALQDLLCHNSFLPVLDPSHI